MISFKELIIEGVGSIITPMTIPLNSRGINIIAGENGAGKSTILLALAWALYSKTIKKMATITPWRAVATGYKGTRVHVKFDIDQNSYEVIRVMDYKTSVNGLAGKNNMYILKDGQLINEEKGVVKALAQVQRLLGYSFELFKHAIVFPQEAVRLMEEAGPAKKGIFEEAFEATFLSQARDIVKGEIQKLTAEQQVASSEYAMLELDYQNTLKRLQDIADQEKFFNKVKKAHLKKIREQIQRLEEQLQEADVVDFIVKEAELAELLTKYYLSQKRIRNYPDHSADEFRMSMELMTKRGKIEELADAKKNIKKELIAPGKCFYCGAPVKDVANKKLAINQRLIEIGKEALQTEQDIIQMQAEYDSLLILVNKRKSLIKKDNILKTKIRELEDTLASEKSKIESIKGIRDELVKIQLEKTQIRKGKFLFPQDLHAQLSALAESQKPQLEEKGNSLEILNNKLNLRKWAINNPLSNAGLKTYLFSIMLKKINLYLKRYESFIGFNVSCVIDKESANENIEMYITFRNSIVSYYDLSKGQKQLANIAAIFALSDTLTETKPINLLVLDEVFESLSENNVEIVSNILADISKTKGIYVISHLSTFRPTNAKVIHLQLSNKFQTELVKL